MSGTRVTAVCKFSSGADAVWRLATDWDFLREASQGMLAYENLPSGRFREGQSIKVNLSLFGLGPRFPWVIEIVELDDRRRVMRSAEHGGGARAWRHAMRVQETATGSQLSDCLELEAGFRGPFLAAFASSMYARRNRRRAQALGARILS